MTGLRLIGHSDLGGRGDGMQLTRHADALYVGHTGTTGAGTSILDVADPTAPRLVEQWDKPANTHTHKAVVANGLLLINHELFPSRSTPDGAISTGVAIYRLDDPFHPTKIGWWECGGLGVHRIVYTGGRYAHVSAVPAGFRDRIWIILDLADPSGPVEAGRWWWPGQALDETPHWDPAERWAAHHANLWGDRAFLGFDDAGVVVLDVSDIAHPAPVTLVRWPDGGGATHTCLPLPGRGLLVVTDEQQHAGPHAPERTIRMLTLSDAPQILAKITPPAGFDEGTARFGAHNLHENQVGSSRSERLIFSTWFAAGVRVYDLADPAAPREVASYVPVPPAGQACAQSNDLWVDDGGLLWVSDRIGGGVDVLEPDEELRDLMAACRLP
jgi:hypothetical protein